MQQDANECWTELVRCLQQQKLEIPLGEGDPNVENAEDEAKAIAMSKGLIDRCVARELILKTPSKSSLSSSSVSLSSSLL